MGRFDPQISGKRISRRGHAHSHLALYAPSEKSYLYGSDQGQETGDHCGNQEGIEHWYPE